MNYCCFFRLQFDDFSEQGQFSALDWSGTYPDDDYIFGDFTERLWAYLTIQQLLEKRSELALHKERTFKESYMATVTFLLL